MRRIRRGALPMMAAMARRTRPWLLAFVSAGAVAAAGADMVTGGCAGAAHLLPFVLVLIPLLAGRYLGEERLARLSGRVPARPRRRVARVCPSGRPALGIPRGGSLIASFLAVRPPPGCSALGA